MLLQPDWCIVWVQLDQLSHLLQRWRRLAFVHWVCALVSFYFPTPVPNDQGLLEKLYTARHSLGLYYSISAVNTYRSRKVYDQQKLEIILTTALERVVRQHAALCCGIRGEATRNPSFVLVETIDLRQVLAFRSLLSGSSVMQHLELEHNEVWSAQETTPPWKVIVLQSENGDPDILDIAFIYHHALGDGMSGAAFHTSMLHALTDVCLQPKLPFEPVNHVTVAPPLSLTPPIEELVKFKNTWSFLVSQVLEEYGPHMIFGRSEEPYTGLQCLSLDELPFRTVLRLLDIDAEMVQSLLANCKLRKVSMTALLSATLALSFALAVPAETLLGQIPYTLRRATGTGYEAIVNQTSAIHIDYEKGLLRDFHQHDADQDAEATIQSVWQKAEEDSIRLRQAVADPLNNNVVGLLPYLTDHHEFHRKKLGKKRETTWEVSNIGAIKARADETRTWMIERAIFTQGAAVVGPALNLNVASVFDGPMTLTFSWQQGVIEESIIASTIATFETTLRKLAGDS